MSRFLPLAMIQREPRPAASAVAQFSRHARQIKATHPRTKMIVAQELHLCGLSDSSSLDEVAQLQGMAEPMDGPRGQDLAALARELDVWLLPGSLCERGENGELFNTLPVYSPHGELVASYRKIFPWLPFEPYDAGNRFVVVDLPGLGRIGLAICYDLWYPEIARNLAWMGAEFIIYPTQTTTCDREQEVIMARATAIQNQAYVLSLNVGAPTGAGRSLLVDPEGLVCTRMVDASPLVLTHVIDFDAVTRVRQLGTCGLNRMWAQMRERPDVLDLPMYGGSIDPKRTFDL